MEKKVNIKITANDRDARGAFGRLQRDMGQLKRTVVGLGTALIGGMALSRLVSGVIDATSEFQRLKASLVTVTGSAEAADAAFETIEDFATNTPYQLTEVVDSFIKLKAMGLDPSMEALRSYGNTASAMGKSLNQMIEAVADAATGEFERLKEFGIKASQQKNKVTFTFQGIKTTVGKNAQEITAYLEKLGNVQFAGGMDRQMDTLGGAISNLKDASDKALRSLGSGEAGEGLISAVQRLAAVVGDPRFLESLATTAGLITNIATGAAIIFSGRGLGTSFYSDIETGAEQVATAREEVKELKWALEGLQKTYPGAPVTAMAEEKLRWAQNNLKRLEDLMKRDPVTPVTTDTSGGAGGGGGEENKKAADAIARLQFEQEQLTRRVEEGAVEQAVHNELKRAGETLDSKQGQTIAALVRANAAQKSSQEAMTEALKEYKQEAASLYEDTRRPLEQTQAQIEKLNFLRDHAYTDGQGKPHDFIDEETYQRAYKKLVADYVDTIDEIEEETVELSEFWKEAFRSMQNVTSDFFFDALEGNFTDLGDSFRTMINRMLADWAAVKTMEGLFGSSFGSGGDLGGLLGAGLGILDGAFSGGSGPVTGTGTVGDSFAIDPFPRAAGGPVFPGRPYLVGEKRPELFVPQTAGSILPNAGAGASISVPVTVQGGNNALAAELQSSIETTVVEILRRHS